MRPVAGELLRLGGGRIRGRPAWPGQLLACVQASASFTSFPLPGPLVRSEFSRPRHCADSQTPGNPKPAAAIPAPILRWRGGPAALRGVGAAFRRSPR